MTHSHLAVRHLIKQVETQRAEGIQRKLRPEWIDDIIDRAADMFEPLAGVGRVGFESSFSGEIWQLNLFLGSTENVGGPADGQKRFVDFRFDAGRLISLFDDIDDMTWTVLPVAGEHDSEIEKSGISVLGSIDGNSLRISIRSTPPQRIGPGLREFPNGELAEA